MIIKRSILDQMGSEGVFDVSLTDDKIHLEFSSLGSSYLINKPEIYRLIVELETLHEAMTDPDEQQ